MRLPLFALSSLLLLAPAVVQAAESGAIRGTVTDGAGLALPGAQVVLDGPNMAGQLATTTMDDGTFRLIGVPPGVHDLTVVKDGFTPLKYLVVVRLDETAFVPVTLVTSADGNAVEVDVVDAALPVIDATRSSVSTQLDSDFLQNVPVGRSFQAVTQVVPGVSGRVDTQNGGPGTGNPSVRGEGQYGNNYLLDGISTRDPATKTFGSDVNFDVIQEVQVYTDGAPAEFGQATGMLVNVVTKDGGDEHFGSLAYYGNTDAAGGTYLILDLETGEEVPTEKRDFFTQELSLAVGGPLVKEKLWYMVGADLGNSRIAFEAMDPTAPYGRRDGQGFAKITWFPTADLIIQAQAGYGLTNIENYETSGLYAPDAQARYASDDLAAILTGRWRPGANGEFEAKASYTLGHIDVVPMSGNEDIAQVFDEDRGLYTGNYDTFDYNTRGRLGGSLKYTQVIDALGSHTARAGVEYWMLTDARELVFTGPGDGVQYNFSQSACDAGEADPDCFVHKTEYVEVGELGHQGNIFGVFLQDDWQPVDPVTLNLGLRVDQETLFQNEGTRILTQWMPAPRLGLAWDVTRDSKTLVTANAGRYYDLNGNTFADWADTKSAYVYTESDWNPTTQQYDVVWVQDPAATPLIYCTEESLSQTSSIYEGYGYTAEEFRAAVTSACGGELDLKPYHMDKVVLGVEREIVPLFALGVKGIVSQTVDLPEDVDYDLDIWVIANPESKRRDYRALELTARRRFDGRWQMLASYTLSESTGSTPGQFEIASGGQSGSNGNQVGVYLDDVHSLEVRESYFDAGFGWFLDGLAGLGRADDDAGYYGYLPYHSLHTVKVSGSYTFGFGTTLGAVYEFDSGHAWQKRGFVDLYGDYFAFPEGRGSRSMPPVNYFDLRVAHEFEFRERIGLELSADVFNVLDLEAPITYYENDNESFGKVLYRQAPRSVRGGLKITY